MNYTLVKKGIHKNYSVEAIFLGIGAVAPGGFVGFLWWRSTLRDEPAWVNIAGILLAALSLVSLFYVAFKVFRLLSLHINLKRVRAVLPTRDTTPSLPPKEFFAAHREEFTALNELILTDSALQRSTEHFSYNWNSSERELGAIIHLGWSVTLTEKHRHILDSLSDSCHHLNITLTFGRIIYTFDDCRQFIYLPQYNKSLEPLEHLDGKWYFHYNN